MLIRALKTTTGRPRGTVHDVDDATGKELIAMGYAIEELPIAKQEAAPANDNRPLARAGGLTGADAQPSFSPEAQAQPRQELTPREDAPKSSLSTTDTNSPHGQTPSTPATTIGGKQKRGRPRSKG